jgi:hypothetical protein
MKIIVTFWSFFWATPSCLVAPPSFFSRFASITQWILFVGALGKGPAADDQCHRTGYTSYWYVHWSAALRLTKVQSLFEFLLSKHLAKQT